MTSNTEVDLAYLHFIHYNKTNSYALYSAPCPAITIRVGKEMNVRNFILTRKDSKQPLFYKVLDSFFSNSVSTLWKNMYTQLRYYNRPIPKKLILIIELELCFDRICFPNDLTEIIEKYTILLEWHLRSVDSLSTRGFLNKDKLLYILDNST